jgi:hypothetical protein
MPHDDNGCEWLETHRRLLEHTTTKPSLEVVLPKTSTMWKLRQSGIDQHLQPRLHAMVSELVTVMHAQLDFA